MLKTSEPKLPREKKNRHKNLPLHFGPFPNVPKEKTLNFIFWKELEFLLIKFYLFIFWQKLNF